VRPITDVTSTALGNKWRHAYRPFGTKSLKERAMCHVGALLGNDSKTSNGSEDVTVRGCV
jgi:hypothetical protein